MKNNLLLLSSLLFISICCIAQPNKINNMGLAAEMIYNKAYTENKLIILLNDEHFVSTHKTIVDSLIIKYQRLQFATDQVVMALTSTLKSFARPRVYKKIDKALFDGSVANLDNNNSRIKGIENGLKEITRLFNDLSQYIEANQTGISIAGVADVDIGGLIQSFLDAYNSMKERSANKANALSDLVQEFRLNPINDLLKKPEPKKEDKKETVQETPKNQ